MECSFVSGVNVVSKYVKCKLYQLQVHAIRKICRECGVDSHGSKMELILRLRDEMKTRSKYDKIFQKIWGASGK